MAEIAIRQRSRRNGWAWPPHALQIISWSLIVYLAVLQFGLLAPAFHSLVTKIVLFVTMGLMIISLIAVKVWVTTIDPADFAVEKKVRGREQPKFDRAKHDHVIQDDYFCNICEEIVHPSSKHCRQCNKCVLDFDHHCKWLNNCVGARNYKWFLIFVGMTVLTCGCISLQSLIAFILYFVQPEVLEALDEDSLLLFNAPVPPGVWIGFVGSSFVLSALIFGLTLHLFVFHLRLLKRGVTTYNFIMDQKKKSEGPEGGGLPPPPPPPKGWMNGLKKGKGASSTVQNGRPSLGSSKATSARPLESSTVPRLPPIRPTSRPLHSAHSEPSSVPYVHIHDSPSSSPSNSIAEDVKPQKSHKTSTSSAPSRATVSTGVSADLERSEPVKLPPIQASPKSRQRPTTSKKLYEPMFESVLVAEKELSLPSILVTHSDSDTLLEQSMNDIPLKAMRSAAGEADGKTTAKRVPDGGVTPDDLPPGSTVYITQGQFTVTKITTPPASAAPNGHRREPIQFREEARVHEKGVGGGRQNTRVAPLPLSLPSSSDLSASEERGSSTPDASSETETEARPARLRKAAKGFNPPLAPRLPQAIGNGFEMD